MSKHTNLLDLIQRADLRRIDVAEQMGVGKSLITRWCQTGVPPKRCVAVAKLLGVDPHVLRPDIFPAPRKAAE